MLCVVRVCGWREGVGKEEIKWNLNIYFCSSVWHLVKTLVLGGYFISDSKISL